MPTEPWLTKAEKEEVRQVVREQRLFGYENKEALRIASERLRTKYKKRETISEKTWENIKRDMVESEEISEWITIYAKKGYIDAYREWMEETLWRKHRLARLFDALTNEPMEQQKKNVHKINSTARSLREETALHASLGLGAPMLLQIKNAMEKGYSKEFVNPDGQPKRLTELRQDDSESIPSDEFAA